MTLTCTLGLDYGVNRDRYVLSNVHDSESLCSRCRGMKLAGFIMPGAVAF